MIASKISLIFTANVFNALSKVPKVHSYYFKNSTKNYLFNYSNKTTIASGNKPSNAARNNGTLFLTAQSYFNIDYDFYSLRYDLLT